MPICDPDLVAYFHVTLSKKLKISVLGLFDLAK